MKTLVKTLFVILLSAYQLSSQAFEMEVIFEDLSSSNGVLYHDFNNDGVSEYIVARFGADMVTMIYEENGVLLTEDLVSVDEPSDLALGDFDQDGRIDIAVAGAASSGIRILRNTGDLNFSTQTVGTFDFGEVGALSAGDLDNDGDLDIVAASYKSDQIVIFEMINPDFFSFNVLTIDNSVDIRELNIGDLNNDGLLDFAASNRFGSEVNIYFNLGNMAFSNNDMSLTGANDNFLADFNNDGLLDIGVTSFSGSDFYILFNNGDDTFTEVLIDGSVQSANAITCFDIDLDGDQDAVIGNSEGIVVFLNDGFENEVFVREDYFFDGWVGPFDVADIDGDSDLDVIASSTGLPGIMHYNNLTINTSSTHELGDAVINIYPNPAIDQIIIEQDGMINFQSSLYSIEGRLVNYSNNETVMSLESIPSGTYLLEILNLESGEKVVEKILVRK